MMRNVWDTKWAMEATNPLNTNQIAFLNKLLEHLPDLNGKRVLEMGSGTGVFSLALKSRYPRAEIVALDYSKVALDQIHPESGVSTKLADAFTTTFEDNSFDVVFTVGLLEHYPKKWPRLIDEQYRILRKNGLALNAVPNVYNLPRTIVYYLQGKNFRYYPAPPFSPFGSIARYYKKIGLAIVSRDGWEPLYPAQTMYAWNPVTRVKSFPLYVKLFRFLGSILEKPTFYLNKLTRNWFNKVFGWEFLLVGKK